MLLLSLIKLQPGHGHLPPATVFSTLTVTPGSADNYMYYVPASGHDCGVVIMARHSRSTFPRLKL